MIIISSISSVGLVTLAFYSFLTTKSYYYYFYIGIIISSIPLIFVVYISSVLIVPELIILLTLIYRGLTIGETYIKTYEAGLTNIPTHLTKTDFIPKNINYRQPESTTSIKNRNNNLENKNYNVKILIVSLLLTATFLSSSTISISFFH
ncbi:MAG: hypothetical protein KGD73_05815 [Candidatus Lokiarchaeota archaeon]|nr:hypothetical protein [Candidatus Lokiarchaeota archaeon]